MAIVVMRSTSAVAVFNSNLFLDNNEKIAKWQKKWKKYGGNFSSGCLFRSGGLLYSNAAASSRSAIPTIAKWSTCVADTRRLCVRVCWCVYYAYVWTPGRLSVARSVWLDGPQSELVEAIKRNEVAEDVSQGQLTCAAVADDCRRCCCCCCRSRVIRHYYFSPAVICWRNVCALSVVDTALGGGMCCSWWFLFCF